MTFNKRAASRTLPAIGPAVSWLCAIGIIPRRLISPTVGLMPTIPFAAEGQMMEPLVSVPTASGTMPAATAIADPELDPHGDRVTSWGFLACPPAPLQPLDDRSERKLAHSLRFALPTINRPALRICSMTNASRPARFSANANEPAVVGRPFTSMLSLISTGTPYSGPGDLLAARSRSSSAACSITWG